MPNVVGTYRCFQGVPGNSQEEHLTLGPGGKYEYELVFNRTPNPTQEKDLDATGDGGGEGDSDSDGIASSGNWTLEAETSTTVMLVDTANPDFDAFRWMSLAVVGDKLLYVDSDSSTLAWGAEQREFVKTGPPIP
jgi:hypothetical protein